MNRFFINGVLLVGSLFLFVGCIEGQPWQIYVEKKEDMGRDVPKEDTPVSDLPDLSDAKTCSPSCAEGLFCDSNQKCVDCLVDDQCASDHCVEGSCVECVEDADCPNKSAAACVGNMCTACSDPEQCGRFPGVAACNLGICQCDSDDDCGDGVCDRRPGSVGICDSTATPSTKTNCEECIADSECMTGECFPTSFDNKLYKHFCLATTPTGVCPIPFSSSGGEITSLGGVMGEICRPNPNRATCDAVLAHLKPQTCVVDTDCPTGGLCRDEKCTYACRGGSTECDNQCSESAAGEIGHCQ